MSHGRWRRKRSGSAQRCGSDAQLVPERVVEPVDDEQQQTEQDGDRAQQNQVTTCAVQAHETTEPHDHDTAEEQTGPQQPRYSRLGIEDSLVAIRRQNGQLAEKLLTDRARRDAGLCTAEHPVHVGERGACGVGGAGIGVGGAGIVLLMPFGALDRRRVFADQTAVARFSKPSQP